MKHPIIKRGNPILNTVCEPVTDIESVRSVIADLTDTLAYIGGLYDFKRGSGISAPQVGYLHRISIVEYEGVRNILINPRIIERSTKKIAIREGCLSFFEYRGNVPRYQSVTVNAIDDKGESITINASDDFAMLLQHEIDHLNGILYLQRLPNAEADLYLVENMPSIP